MGDAIDSLLRRLVRTGFRHGISGEHWAWFVLAGGAFLLRRAHERDDKAAKITLRPGDRYLIEVRGGDGRGRGEGGGDAGRRRGRDGWQPRATWHGDRVTTATEHAE